MAEIASIYTVSFFTFVCVFLRTDVFQKMLDFAAVASIVITKALDFCCIQKHMEV